MRQAKSEFMTIKSTLQKIVLKNTIQRRKNDTLHHKSIGKDRFHKRDLCSWIGRINVVKYYTNKSNLQV